jgi:hypothetical protein
MVSIRGMRVCSGMCSPDRMNCAAGCCACIVPGSQSNEPSPSEPRPASFSQHFLDGVTFPTFSVSGLDNIFNDMTVPTLPDVTGVSVESLKQNVTVPTVPAATAPAAPAASDSSMNWLWVLVIIPIGIAASAFSK